MANSDKLLGVAVTKIPAETARVLKRPTWARAVLAAVLGVFSLVWHGNEAFVDLWGGNDLLVARIVLAAFFVLSASAVWEYAKQSPVPDVLRGGLALGAASWLLLGAAIIFFTSSLAIGLLAGAAMTVMGVAELVGGLRTRKDFVPSRDHVLVGAVGTITGVVLLAWWDLDIHGVVGVAGMGAILIAVLLMIAAAGMRHEAQKS